MDLATPENKIILGTNRKCSQDSDLDRHINLCPGGYRKEKIPSQSDTL